MSSNAFDPAEIRLIKEYFKTEAEQNDAVRRLKEHEPLAYILGEWGFYGEMYKVSPACLIPRPDTEHLVDKLTELLPSGGSFLELCTGSGCISVSALVHRPDASAAATDISKDALEIASENANRYGLICSGRLRLICADLFEPLLLNESFDIIVANPPYIKTGVIKGLSEEVKHEPVIALDGGEDGLRFYRHIVSAYAQLLKPGGKMLFEIGYDQAEDIKKLGAASVYKDYGGNDRVAVFDF